MKPEDRSRFLIALAKYLGVQPLRTDPLSSIRLSEEWHLDECLKLIIVDSGRVLLPIARFNELMLHCGRPLVSAWFFEYFFRDIETIDQFEAAVERFRIAAMWVYGNFKFAHRALGTCSEEEFSQRIRQTKPRLPEADRQPFTEIEDIPDDELPMLGYISSGRVKAIAGIITEVERMVADPAHALDIWRGLGPVATKFGEALRAFGFRLEIVDGALASTPPELPALLAALKEREPQLMAKLTGAQEKGRRNTHRYLTLPYLDVYVATSMRSDDDFIEQHRFVKQVFEDPEPAPLRLRYFDPTLSWVKSRITKGLVEALMLRRAKVTIYNAGERETLGKDSELAATLAQGKPVIVYVREGAAYDARADNYRADHPLGLQIALSTGVAHGIIVVRTAAQCARLLRRVLLRELPLEVRHEEGNYQLVELETQSVLRVVSDDPLLTHSFWAFFHVNSDV
ncbi:MAG: hypothetical protein A3H96_02230 [Acidobacteria bacterium RIFCSPLOWO2_02_FULL_67_36]|nr:MAG: hypothetical protein A3H96_02230 [Acidobacteria bacterium RIFCSPLOWO2_02_FULL_67_36]